MEDKDNYTYSYRRKKMQERQRLMIIVLGGFGVLLILAVVLGAVAGNKSAVKQYNKENPETTLRTVENAQPAASVPVTQKTEPEIVGYYAVDTDTINIRSDHSIRDDNRLCELSEGTVVTVAEIYEDPNADGNLKRWGRIVNFKDSKGTVYPEGWVVMYLLKETSAPAEPAEPSETGYQPGKYQTAYDGVRVRNDHSTSNTQVIAKLDKGTTITITEIYEDTSSSKDTERFWGKGTTEKGDTGWVAMYYLTVVR